MKKITERHLIAFVFLMSALSTRGATFDSGSDGSYGALDVTNSVPLEMPPDGIFRCTTIRVRTGTVLTFKTNLLNTPVVLLAQGDVVVELAAVIDISGGPPFGAIPRSPGPGGFPGGFGKAQNYAEGDGLGPGGGRIGNNSSSAAFAFPAGGNTNTYGNVLLVPLVGGSGAAAGSGQAGGSGAGAILIASSTRVSIVGKVFARGLSGASGGAIRLVAPLVDGAGDLDVSAGSPASPGRVRIDTLDRFAWRGLNLTGAGRWTTGAQMTTGLGDPRRLDIVEVAGQTIAPGAASGVDISLPVGSDTNQVVKVRASGFASDVPITVALIPENGRSVRYDSVIPTSGSGAVTNAVNVIVPIDVITRVQVWSR